MLKCTTTFRMACISRACLVVALVSICPVGRAVEQGSTLLLYNLNDPDSVAIRDRYLQVYPLVRSFGLELDGLGEQITAQTYLDEIRAPILNELTAQPWGDLVDTLVTTKGLPLRIDAGWNPVLNWRRYSSLESELTRIDVIDTIQKMGDQDFGLSLINIPGVVSANPYYLGLEFDFSGNLQPYPPPTGFDRTAPINEGIRLAARLDGFSQQDVFDMIDRAQSTHVLVPIQHYVVVDDDPSTEATLEDAMERLALEVLPNWGQQVEYDNSTTDITSASGPIIGYTSHGTRAGLPLGQPGNLANTGYINTELNFELLNGAVFHTYESFNAFTFNPTSTAPHAVQGQVGQWIAIGGTAALGHVQEPGASKWSISNEDVFYDMMLSGFTFAEAAWASTRQLSYVNTVVGDPLMRWQQWLPGDTNLDGVVEFNDFYTLQGNWWQTGSFADGDFNGDNYINADDFDILQGNWLSSAGLAALGANIIQVLPELDEDTGVPFLAATLLVEANLDGDLDVDGDDLALLWASYGVDDGADLDQDGDTDGADFLKWQTQYQLYTLTADFNINGVAEGKDLAIWENSYGKNRGGDSDGNSFTDGFDFLAWQREVSIPAPEEITATQTAVPEPATVCSALVSAVALLTRGRRRR